MPQFSASVRLGSIEFNIEGSQFLEIYEAVAAIQELNAAAENEDFRLIVRSLKNERGTYRKYGFRRIRDDAVMDLGMSQETDKPVPVFAYSRLSPSYRGFRKKKPSHPEEENNQEDA